nr:hypothetical protein [Tanacetum cinerariifolium]
MEDDEEEDPEEEPKEDEPVPEPNNMDGFALHPLPQPEGNINGWLIEDDDDLEEYDVGDDNEENMEVDKDDEEYEFAPPVVPIFDANDEPIPSVILFSGNFHVRESLSTRTLLAGNNWVHVPGPMGCNLESVHRGVKRLDRENSSEYSKMKKFVEGLSKQFNELKEQCRLAERLSHWKAYVRQRVHEGLRFQEDPFKPSIHPASAPRSDDPYVMGMSVAAIKKLVADKVVEVLEVNHAGGSSGNVEQGGAPPVQECTFTGFMKCDPT